MSCVDFFCYSMVFIMVFAAHIIVAKSHSSNECNPSQKCICMYCILKVKLNALNMYVHCLNKPYIALKREQASLQQSCKVHWFIFVMQVDTPNSKIKLAAKPRRFLSSNKSCRDLHPSPHPASYLHSLELPAVSLNNVLPSLEDFRPY